MIGYLYICHRFLSVIAFALVFFQFNFYLPQKLKIMKEIVKKFNRNISVFSKCQKMSKQRAEIIITTYLEENRKKNNYLIVKIHSSCDSNIISSISTGCFKYIINEFISSGIHIVIM